MYKSKVEILMNYSERRRGYDGYLFEAGSTTAAHHTPLSITEEVSQTYLFRLKILSSSSKEKLVLEIKKQDPKKSLLVCFRGSDSDLLELENATKDNAKWSCVSLREGLRYDLSLYWDYASKNNYFCNIVSLSKEVFKPVKSKTKTKKEKSDVNVNLPKPNNAKKTNK